MIVREREHAFVMIEQHHHGYLAGKLFSGVKENLLPSGYFREAISYAIFHHDRGWIPFDQEPFLNDENLSPYSFSDLPIGPKIVLYKYGVDEVEEESPYAALLCSMHYVSFLHDREDDLTRQFVQDELMRQKSIKHSLQLDNQFSINKHYELLKFFDDLSLYICLNEPGVTKENEHYFFRKGITLPSTFGGGELQLDWSSKDKIFINERLFKENVVISLQQKVVAKNAIAKYGLKKAYTEAVIEEVPVQIQSTLG